MKLTKGAVVTEPGSTAKTKTGGWRTFAPVIDNGKCIDCGNCWIYCPEGCIYRDNGVYSADLDYCKGCGICENECPSDAIKMILEEK